MKGNYVDSVEDKPCGCNYSIISTENNSLYYYRGEI